MKKVIFCFFILVVLGFFLTPVSAQRGPSKKGPNSVPDLVGDVEIESTTAQKRSYGTVQKSVIEFFDDLEKKVESGNIARLRKLDESEANYIAAVYLFCTIRQGVCPFILDAILETDIINSTLGSKAECPNMKSLWKAWLSADMERRLEYSQTLAMLNKTKSFKKNQRPKYIQCEATVSSSLSEEASPSDFFSDRYQGDSHSRVVIRKVPRFLRALQQKKINVFSATGTKG